MTQFSHHDRQLLTCFEALQRAATPPKVTDEITNVMITTQALKPTSSESDTDDSDSLSDETGTESDTEDSGMDSETDPESVVDDRMNQKDPVGGSWSRK